MIKWFTDGRNSLISLWIVLSVLMIICASFFRIDGYIAFPQHGIFDKFLEVTRIIKETKGKEFWYRLFFIADFFWAFCTLTLIGYLIRRMNGFFFVLGAIKISLFQVYMVFAVLALVLDTTEGIFYLWYLSKQLETVTILKIISYIISFSFLVYWVLRKYVIPNFKPILRFVLTSMVSLVFILLIYLLLTVMPQGGTLVVHLFHSPSNIILLFFLMTFLAILLSHFPVYVDIWLNANNDIIELEMADEGFRFLGFGIIYYNTKKNRLSVPDTFTNQTVANFRRSLGILFYVAVFNIFLGVASRFFEVNLNVNGLTVLILVITLIVYYRKGVEYTKWKKVLDDQNSTDEREKAVVVSIVNYVKGFPRYFVLCTLMVFAAALVVWLLDWDRLSLVLVMIALGFQMFLYIYFKISRSFFKYVYFSEKLYDHNPEMFNPRTLKLFREHDKEHGTRDSSFYRYFGTLSDNIQYLKLMQFSGYISLLLIIVANLSFTVATFLNPINIILIYIIVIYSVIIMAFKHVLYYHRNGKSPKRYRNFFKYGLPVLTFLIIVLFSYNITLENDLHELKLVQKKEGRVEHGDFLKSITNEGKEKDNYFFVGSYGGGLKANLWNLLIFNELENNTDNDFLKSTIALSGVSGGAVGIGNYASLTFENKGVHLVDSLIFEIGKSNVLSNELVYLLGKDWIREYLPYFDYSGKDRSFMSMKNHAALTGMGENYNSIAFTDYWHDIYNARKGKFPALIMNTTSTSGNHGVASSVKFPDDTFPAADPILDFRGSDSTKTLTYFGAISTTNRFPIFSPTAKIRSKGSYLDGGYFENSGMLSVLELYLTITADSSKSYHDKINPIFINIINSEDFYIEEKVINEWKFKKKSLDKAGELSSIIGTVTSIDKLPRHVSGRIAKLGGVRLEPIMMPHKITYKKVKQVLRADVDDPIRLMKHIKAHNDVIDSALSWYRPYKLQKWGVVQPPLARVLSVPAVRYQEAMIKCHPDVLNTLDRIYQYTKIDTIFTFQIQEQLKTRPNSNYFDEIKTKDTLQTNKVDVFTETEK